MDKMDKALIGVVAFVVIGFVGIVLLGAAGIGAYFLFFQNSGQAAGGSGYAVYEEGVAASPSLPEVSEGTGSSVAESVPEEPAVNTQEETEEPEPAVEEEEPEPDCDDPEGFEGDRTCDAEKVMECEDGEWVKKDTCHSANACMEGACTEKACSSPTGYIGEYLCAGYGSDSTSKYLYECTADNWEKTSTCSSVSKCDAENGLCKS